MLIVVVIIGILAAALIPRLQSVQGRARDTKRKADLTQIGSALAVYKSDNGNFVAFSGSAVASVEGTVKTALTNYLTSMPTDADASAVATITTGTAPTAGQYAFSTLTLNGAANQGFALGAKTEVDGSSSNWVYLTATAINPGAEVSTAQQTLCSKVDFTTGTPTLASCTALKDGSIRYVYVQ